MGPSAIGNSMQNYFAKTFSGAHTALWLLLSINLFNYIDRYILAALLPTLKQEFLAGDPNQNAKAGLLTTAFLVSYMCTAPIFGWLADRFSRWMLVGIGVAVWSLASGWSGLAASFAILLWTRIFVGVGEAAYGPAAPTIISDLYPLRTRGRMLALFYIAIPVGSALGYAFGGKIGDVLGWRWAFYLVVPPGLLLAAFCFWMRDPGAAARQRLAAKRATFRDYLVLFRIRSYILNTAAMTVMTFAIGGFSAWLPDYIFLDRGRELSGSQQTLGNIGLTFGAITALAGLLATFIGGWTGDKLRERFASSYFLVSGAGMILCFPATLAVIYVRFPLAWIMIFIAEFFLFFNTGPSNTALANVTPRAVRASAFALNIFIIHALGDAISPPLIGAIRDRWNMDVALTGVAFMMLLAGLLWFWGAKFLPADTAAVEIAAQKEQITDSGSGRSTSPA
jgi:MFS family permease